MFLQKLSNFRNLLHLPKRNIVKSDLTPIPCYKSTLTNYIIEQCDKFPDNIALIDDKRSIKYKYKDLKQSIHSIASNLTKQNVQLDTMCAIIGQNCPEYLMLIYALTGMRCPVTICNQNFTEFEMTHQITDSRPRIIFTDEENLSKVQAVISKVDFVQEIYVMGTKKPTLEGVKFVDDLLDDSGNQSPIGSVDIDLMNDIALMPYSSGTTGLPKGVMLTNSNLVTNKLQIKHAHLIGSPEVMLMSLPLYHIYATVIKTAMAFYNGSTIVVQPKFIPELFLKAIEKYKVTYLHLVPPQVLFFLNYPQVKQTDISSIKSALSSAAPLDKVTEETFCGLFNKHQAEFSIYQGYGATELSPLATIMPNEDKLADKYGSVGKLLPNLECKIVDITNRSELGPGESGEILFRGPNVMKGYFGKSGSTKDSFEDEWFKTGDIGYYDRDNYFYISDRIKELIKVKGYQVAPAELEGVLLTYPGILDCAVVGVKDERCGEVPKAFVVTDGKEISKSRVYEYIEKTLSDHKKLRGGIEFVKEIPKSPSGKILRRVLRDK